MNIESPQISKSKSSIRIFGVRIDSISLDYLLSEIQSKIKTKQQHVFSYVNIHALNLSYQFPWFREFLNQSEIVFCDGVGVILGARLTGQRLEHRYTPPDWIGKLCELSREEGFSIYLIGSRPDVAEKAAEIMQKQHPGCNIVGTHHGYFDKTPGSEENDAVIAEINCLNPDLLLVGFGMPMQERWLAENLQHLNVHVALPVGAAFDYVSGEVRRAPRWMTDNGLEWLGRLIIEPRRLWKRYLIGNPLFFWRIFLQRLGLLHLPDTPIH